MDMSLGNEQGEKALYFSFYASSLLYVRCGDNDMYVYYKTHHLFDDFYDKMRHFQQYV